MEKEILQLLNGVNAILREEKIKKEESMHRGERFNMFETCGVAHYEVMHSSIIASFMNPAGSHGQKDLFLKWFIYAVGDDTKIDTAHASVYTEYPMENGRIDILVKDNKGKGIIIENKIYAGDQAEQLKRYNRYARKSFKGGYKIYYLTLEGHEASIDSGDGVDYTRISYSEHILAWISLCIKECATKPLIRETLIQYQNHIKQLTKQDMENVNKEELIRLMTENADAIAAIFNVQEDYKQQVFVKYVESPLKEFCEKEGLTYESTNLFNYGKEKGFYFRKKEWKEWAIWVYSEAKRGNYGFYWGISNYQNITQKVQEVPLDCIGGSPTAMWPYGWAYLEKYSNWDDMSTVAAMVSGSFAQYIEELVLKALEELARKHMPMP